MEDISVNYDNKNSNFADLLIVATITTIMALLLFSCGPKYSGWQTTVDDIIVFINENIWVH